MSPAEVHLWLAAPVDVDPGCLDDDERARAGRFRFDEHRRIFLAAHVLARRALAHHGDVPAQSWRFEAGPHGRPEIVDPPGRLRFNISHTDGLVACIVGTGAEIGVDVEHTDRGGRLLDVAERYFSAEEAGALRGLPAGEQPHRFLQYWTLKESYIKARGLGLALPLAQFTFLLDGERPRVRFDPRLEDHPERWQFTLEPRGERHLVATAVATEDGRPARIVRHDGAELLVA